MWMERTGARQSIPAVVVFVPDKNRGRHYKSSGSMACFATKVVHCLNGHWTFQTHDKNNVKFMKIPPDVSTGAGSSREQGLQSWPPDITSKGGGCPCTVRYNTSMVIVTWRLFPPPSPHPTTAPLIDRLSDTPGNIAFPQPSLAGGNKTSLVRLRFKTYLPPYRQKGKGMKGSRDSKFCLDIHFAYVECAAAYMAKT